MEVVKILQQLGMDSTVFIQFAIFCAIYFISAPLFIKKLQYVIDNRENKTTVLKKYSEDIIEKAKKISDEYQEKLDDAKSLAQKEFHKKKHNKTLSELQKIKAIDEELTREYELKRSEFIDEINNKRIELIKHTDELSSELVNRLR